MRCKSSVAALGVLLVLGTAACGPKKADNKLKADASNPVVQQDKKLVETRLQTCVKTSLNIAHPSKTAEAVRVCMVGPGKTGEVCFNNEVKAFGFTTKSDREKLASALVTKCGAK